MDNLLGVCSSCKLAGDDAKQSLSTKLYAGVMYIDDNINDVVIQHDTNWQTQYWSENELLQIVSFGFAVTDIICTSNSNSIPTGYALCFEGIEYECADSAVEWQ